MSPSWWRCYITQRHGRLCLHTLFPLLGQAKEHLGRPWSQPAFHGYGQLSQAIVIQAQHRYTNTRAHTKTQYTSAPICACAATKYLLKGIAWKLNNSSFPGHDISPELILCLIPSFKMIQIHNYANLRIHHKIILIMETMAWCIKLLMCRWFMEDRWKEDERSALYIYRIACRLTS